MREFDYLRPSSLVEACQFLRDSGGQRRALAGGTDLLVQVKQERLQLQAVVSLRDLPELAFIRHKPGHGLTLGAMTRLREIETSRDVLRGIPGCRRGSLLDRIVSSENPGHAGRQFVQRRALSGHGSQSDRLWSHRYPDQWPKGLGSSFGRFFHRTWTDGLETRRIVERD